MRKFGRKKPHRDMMIKNLVTSTILYEKTKTTLAKAKESITFIEKAINIGKKNTLSSRRKLMILLKHENAVKKVFEDLILRYKNRTGGYLNIYKINKRVGDGSQMAIISLIPAEKENKKVEVAIDNNSDDKKNNK